MRNANAPMPADPPTNDEVLIARCVTGDEVAWREVLDRYGRLVMAIALGNGLGADDAADVAQSTFLALLQGMDTLRPDTTLGPWLATVARRQSWRYGRRAGREAALTDGVLPGEVDDRSDAERQEWLLGALSKLDPRCRNLLGQLYLASTPASYAEAAAGLQIAIGSVGPTRARCLGRLRALLEAAIEVTPSS